MKFVKKLYLLPKNTASKKFGFSVHMLAVTPMKKVTWIFKCHVDVVSINIRNKKFLDEIGKDEVLIYAEETA